MEIDLNNDQKYLLLETLAIAHSIKKMRGLDQEPLETLIKQLVDSLKKEGNIHIFESVYIKI